MAKELPRLVHGIKVERREIEGKRVWGWGGLRPVAPGEVGSTSKESKVSKDLLLAEPVCPSSFSQSIPEGEGKDIEEEEEGVKTEGLGNRNSLDSLASLDAPEEALYHEALKAFRWEPRRPVSYEVRDLMLKYQVPEAQRLAVEAVVQRARDEFDGRGART